MVALLHPSDFDSTPPGRPRLEVIDGGVADDRPGVNVIPSWSSTVALALVALVVMLAILFRIAQGAPPASSWDGLADNAYGISAYSTAAAGTRTVAPLDVAAATEATYVVQAGDTLWGIALKLAPGEDPRPLVDEMADRNGGLTLQVGQQLIVRRSTPVAG